VTQLRDRLDSIASTYQLSVRALQQFVEEMSKGIDITRSVSIASLTAQVRQFAADLQTAGTPLALAASVNAPAGSHSLSDTLQARLDSFSRANEEEQRLRAQHYSLLFEMAFIYRVALHDAFLPDAIRAVLVNRPDMLRSNKKMTHEQILDQPNISALIELMADKELTEFSYGSVNAQRAWISDHMGIALFASDEQHNDVVELTGRRNLFVHANGIVNWIYLTAVVNSRHRSGERLFVDKEYWSQSDGHLKALSVRLISALQEKYCS
jgi:hypothetical protein